LDDTSKAELLHEGFEMAQIDAKTGHEGSKIDPRYSTGDYFSDPTRHSADADFKATNFLKVFLPFAKRNNLQIESIVDVGCGTGDVVKKIADKLASHGFERLKAKGYDVSPHVLNTRHEGVEYILGDFCESDEFVDVATLFDVFEHVTDTIEFLRSVSERCKVACFHIPLDYSLNQAIRNGFKSKLEKLGHLIFLDAVSALNLLALSGLRVVDYQYTFGFLAPSGHLSTLSKLALPFRYLLARISPWLLSKTLGGANLMVIAITPKGLREMQQSGSRVWA
jgi:SAM-dependent methyltransferase